MSIYEGLSKTFNIPISHLDYIYIDKCDNVCELEKIYLTLKTGEEGMFPDLVNFCQAKLEKVSPNSRVLRKVEQLPALRDLEPAQRAEIVSDLQEWLGQVSEDDSSLLSSSNSGLQAVRGCGDEDTPPIRTNHTVVADKSAIKTGISGSHKSCTPKDYNEWSKIAAQLEKEVIQEEEEELQKQERDTKENQLASKKNVAASGAVSGLSLTIDSGSMTALEKEKAAVAEKDKGNEAYRSGDLEEARVYYSRSLSLQSCAAVFNNRGLVYMKQKKLKEALKDLNATLNLEPENIKGLQRRANCHYETHNLPVCISDCQKVLKFAPDSKLTESLLEKAQVELDLRCQPKLEGGKRMVIREVGSDDEEEEEDEDERPHNGVSGEDKDEKKLLLPGSELRAVATDTSESRFLEVKEKGNDLFKQQRYEDALAQYDMLVSDWPTKAVGYRNRASVNLVLQRAEAVVRDCDTAIELDPNSHLSFYRRGRANKMLGDFERSLCDLEKSMELSPNEGCTHQIIDEFNEVKTLHLEKLRSVPEPSNVNDTLDRPLPTKGSPPEAESPEWEMLEKPAATDRVVTLAPMPSNKSSLPMNAAEFERGLNRVRRTGAKWTKMAQLLVDATPARLVQLMGNKLDGFVLETIISSLAVYCQNPDHAAFIKQTLEQVSKIQRFDFVKMMISDHAHSELVAILERLRCKDVQDAGGVSASDVNMLEKMYN